MSDYYLCPHDEEDPKYQYRREEQEQKRDDPEGLEALMRERALSNIDPAGGEPDGE